MLKLLGKWLKVYEDEIGLFVWTVVLFFLLRSSNILLNNYAETAFLKRFGVEYLPILYMLNAIALFVIMGLMTAIMGRLPGARLLSYLFVFCGVSTTVIRFLIPFGIDLLYPLLFMLKAQFEALLGLLFWNLANDLFNTIQSKRLFPLITAGGVLGQIIGSFGTPFLAKAISLDNILLAYLVTTLCGAVIVNRMEGRYPALLLVDRKKKEAKSRSSMVEEFRKILPLMKESALVKILVLLTFIPNIVIPILNYQFNYAVNAQFATESGLIEFFGYFRGVLNIISLIILMFVGRIYGRWGLPVALMFHPFNYVLAFLGFLFRFDVFAAIYARMTTMILRTTINNPARNILMGLFPESFRAVVRPFLRGTVVRIGLFLGSGIILVSEKFFHPKYLSLVAIPFVSMWVVTVFILKRQYSKILTDLVSRDMLDLKALEETDIEQLFRDKDTQSHLTQAFLSARGNRCLWYAGLLKSLAVPDLDTQLLAAIKHQDDKTRIGLLELLSSQSGVDAVEVLTGLADTNNPELLVAVIKAANRLDTEFPHGFYHDHVIESQHPEVRAHAVIGLYQRDPSQYHSRITSWLNAEDIDLRKAGIIAAGETGEQSFAAELKGMLDDKENETVLSDVLKGLQKLGEPDMNALALRYLSYPSVPLRVAALETMEIIDDELLKKIIPMLGDSLEQVHELTKRKIETAPYHNAQLLVELLSLPDSRVRKGIFSLLESLDVKDLDIFRFARGQLHSGYQYLAEAERLRTFPESPERNLLVAHLNQKLLFRIENILRVLAAQDRSGEMKIIYRGVFSSDTRQRSNALEALDNLMDNALFKIMIPLLEISSAAESLAVGRRNFTLLDADIAPGEFVSHLLSNDDWVTVVLAMSFFKANGFEQANLALIEALTRVEDRHIRMMAHNIIDHQTDHPGRREDVMQNEVMISDKILLLKGIEIFEGLAVSELAAVASVTEELNCPPGEIVIKEGSSGETMYLIIDGEVSVIKDLGKKSELELDRIRAGDYFGEMALFENVVRSASIRTEQESRLLVLHKQEFNEIVREYPQIALEICKVLGGRIRTLHEKIKSQTYCDLTRAIVTVAAPEK